MKNEGHKKRLGMWMVAAAASLLAACTMEDDKLTAEESTTTKETSPVTGEEFAFRAIDSVTSSAVGGVPAAAFPCRKVTASSIPIFATATGSAVHCTFFAGDVFQYLGTGSPPLRYETWCPRHVPLSQGEISWAQASGTVAVTCPF